MTSQKQKKSSANKGGKGSGRQQGRKRSQRAKADILLHEGLGAFLCLLGIFSGICVFAVNWSGVLGEVFYKFLHGFFGITCYAVPFFLIAAGIGLIFRNRFNETFAVKWAVLVCVHWFVAAIITAVICGLEYRDKAMSAALAELYTTMDGGGLFGGLLSLPLVRLVQVPFAVLVLSLLTMAGLMVVTEVTPGDLWYLIKCIGRGIKSLFKRIAGAFRRQADRTRERSDARRQGREAADRDRGEEEVPPGVTPRRITYNGQPADVNETAGTSDDSKAGGRDRLIFGGVDRSSEKYGASAKGQKFHVPDLGTEAGGSERPKYSFEEDDSNVINTYRGEDADADRFTRKAEQTVETRDTGDVPEEMPPEDASEQAPAEQPAGDEVRMMDVSGLRKTAEAQASAAAGGTESAVPANSQDITFVVADKPVEAVQVKRKHSGADYVRPDVKLLKAPGASTVKDIEAAKEEAFQQAKTLETTLENFGVAATVKNITRGPAVTRFELKPSQGVRVNKITSLADDIALNLAAGGIRIEAPIPGVAAVGIEIPNKKIDNVLLREGLESEIFNSNPSPLAVVLGKSITGDIVVSDLGKMPHLLIAGATGSGKSVCINCIIMSLLYKSGPDQVKLIMIDPKVVELGIYNGIPHLMIPVVTDPKKAAGALGWAVNEMERRYSLFSEKGVRDLTGYNEVMKRHRNPDEILPKIVIIIDELADLMMVAPAGVEDAICRLAQKARAAGLYLIVATQRPSVDVITGIIKANITSRIAFAVKSQIDSRTILDMSGAEKLLGKGDMLYYPIGQNKPTRVKGAFVSDQEVEDVVEYLKNMYGNEYDDDIQDEIDRSGGESSTFGEGDDEADEFLEKAIDIAVEAQQISVSYLQRRLKVGHSRAGRIIDQMEERGIVGPAEGSKPRQVRISPAEWMEMKSQM